MRTLPALALAVLGTSVLASAQQWPQFRGPDGQGHAADSSGLPSAWTETSNIAWKTAVPGRGWSSPVLGHGRVWLTTAVTAGRDVSLQLVSFDETSGALVNAIDVFKIRSAQLLNAKNSFASPTPIVDDDRVYAHFGTEGTAAVGFDGTILWKARYQCLTQHGSGGSPVLYRGLLILTCDGADAAFVVALDTRTGKEKWKTWRREPWSQAYATPLIIEVGDSDQLISPAAFHVAAYDPLNGREIWRVRYDDGFSNVPRPVFAAGLVFVTTGFQQPSLFAIRPDGKGDVTRTNVAWRLARGVPYTPSPIAEGDNLYMVSDTGVLSCLEARTGTLLWQQRLPGNYSASPILANGLIYFSSEEGVTTVIRPGAKFDLVAVNQLDTPILASMAVGNGSLFVRTATHLYRVGKAGL